MGILMSFCYRVSSLSLNSVKFGQSALSWGFSRNFIPKWYGYIHVEPFIHFAWMGMMWTLKIILSESFNTFIVFNCRNHIYVAFNVCILVKNTRIYSNKFTRKELCIGSRMQRRSPTQSDCGRESMHWKADTECLTCDISLYWNNLQNKMSI